MKKLIKVIMITISLLMLTGCSMPWQEQKVEWVQTDYDTTGTVTSVSDTTISMVADTGEFLDMTLSDSIDVSDLHQDTTISIQYHDVQDSTELIADSISILEQPLRWVLGYTPEELISTQNEYNSKLLNIKEALSGTASYKGKQVPYSYMRTTTVRNDPYVRHTMTSTTSTMDEVSDNTRTEVYLTNVEAPIRYSNSNYSGWYYTKQEDLYAIDVDASFDPATVTVQVFEQNDDSSVTVEFLWDFANDKNNIIAMLMTDTISSYGLNPTAGDTYVSASYDCNTRDLLKIEVTVANFGESAVDEIPLNVNVYNLSVYGIGYNEIEEVSIPETVIESAIDSYYIDNPMPVVPDFVGTDLLCQSLCGKDFVMIDDVKQYAGFTDDITEYQWGISADELAGAIKDWLNGYSAETFMSTYATMTDDYSYIYIDAAGIVYTWLQPYGYKLAEYKPAPTE